MKIYVLLYDLEIMNASTGMSTKEKREFVSQKIEEIIVEYRDLKDKWYISKIELYIGELEQKSISFIDRLL